MQNFSNSPAPSSLPPGFSGRSVAGPPYPSQPAEPQISPRMTDDYAGMQQQSLHRGHPHPGQASHMLAYSSRNRGAVELPPAHASMHSGNSNNPYRKAPMEYYFSVGGKDRSRTMGMGFGTSFGYPNMDGHIPHQYRPTGSGSTPPVGLMSPYPVDYGAATGTGGGAGGAFSPSHQYNMAQNPAMQSVPSSQMQHRQHGQTFPSVHQQHRNYPQSGHRMTPQYPQYSPQGGGSTGSSGMYSPPPQRYLDGAATTGFDPKINSSPSVTAASNSGSVASNNVGPMENVQQSYHASNYAGYSPQTHSLHKQATLQHRSSQHNLGVGYDNSLKMQHQGSSSGTVYAKHQQASNPSIPQTTSLELAKSPMPPNAQQTQMNQNFSPISNPSPAASAVHSPSCSSSPSPLMGVSEAHGPSGHVPSHPPISNPRSNHGHARLLQTIPQLSPTPNSNSSISSCGSSGSHKAHSRTAVGCNVPPAARNKMGLGGGIGQQDENSAVYSSSHNKMQDSSLNSLNALSSQVANLPNTVQHMILTDTVLSQKRGKDELLAPSQPRSRNASATSSTSTIKDGGVGVEVGPEEEQFSDEEHGRRRQMSGASSGSETSHPPASQSQQQTSNAPQAKEAGEVESKIGETGPKPHSPPSSISCSLPNSISEHPSGYNENGVSLKKNSIIKNEIMKNAADGVEKKQKLSGQNVDIKTQNSQVKESKPHAASRLQDNEREEKHTLEEQQSASSVGVIVSARSEASLNEKNKPESTEEKQPRSRDSSSHNGEEGVDLSLSSHQRSHLGLPQNLSQTGPQKYGYPESTYGSDLSMKNRGRTGLGGVIESNSKYAGYQQSQTSSVAEPTVKRGRGPTAAQGDNAQMQQFPSLLQEVLQGYNLDRRYGRPEQVYPTNLQHQFQNRHPYSLTESMQMQSDATNAQLGSSEKNLHPKQRNANESDFAAEASVKLESSGAKCSQKTEKNEMGVSKSTLPHAADAQQPPPKHINLADYSLPQRKALSHISSHSSAVQELLLQEPEPLTGSSGQSEAQKPSASVLAPSERRSVICDMSPNRRSTPERDRESDREREKSQSGASVIQQPFSSPAAANDVSKKDSGEKLVSKVEAAPKEADTGNFLSIHHTDLSRRGNVDAPPMPPHALSTNPLSSPSRHQTFLRGMDLSTGNASSSFHGYTFGDMREGMMPRNTPHFPSHHPYHNLSGQSQSANKLMYPPHPRAPLQLPQDMNDWFKAMSRTPKDVMMQPGSSPGRQKISQSEQRQRMMSHPDMASDRSSMQSSFYDMKIWEATHSGRDGEAFYRTQPPPLAPPPPPVASHNPVPPEITPASNAAEFSASRGPTEETKHPCPNPMISTAKLSTDIHSPPPQTQRQIKAGASGDTNPLMLRRRVRSFISPIPAKRQLQDTPQQRAATANSYHSPGAHSETSHHNEDDSSSSEISCPRLSSPLSRENTYSQALSPSNSNTKVTPPRKGRGLKLEAIVQKITPNIKKPAAHTDEEPNHYSSFSHPNEMQPLNDIQNQDLTHFPKVAGRDDGYMDEGHSLNDMIPFQRVDEALAPSTYKPDSRQTSQTMKQKDFDFGIPASASGDKEDFALLGPLPPPPPLPRPVQGSPPPSSSALSDIQHFTNTYQQLETRRGEQSAANLLRQKLQESGMGFDDYPGSDYYGTTPPQGHMLSRQHQMSSSRSSLSPQDLKQQDNLVPKGYFPSGKKKGRPVGSVNKQKRAQNQGQTTSQTSSQAQPAAPHAPPALSTVSTPATMAPQPAQGICSPESGAPPLLENKTPTPPPLAPPILTQVSKVDLESEDTQPELEVKPVRRRRRGVKDEDEPFEAGGKQRRRRRGAAAMPPSLAKDDPDVPLNAGRGLTNRACLDPNRKGPFVPHIHVENKVPEIGAVCTIINAEEDKMKGERSAVGGKASSSGIDSLLTSALSSQLSRRDRESEKRETDEVETTLQSGKALPSSGYVVSGPVITETNHSGRLLCCLCQKWANYKNLGDLYGPYYPAEYVAKLPKNQPQVRQCQTPAGANKIGPNSETSSNTLSTTQDLQTKEVMPYAKPSNYSDYPVSLDSYLSRTVQTAFPAPQEEMMHITERFSSTSPFLSSSTTKPSRLSWDMNVDIMHIPELKREPDVEGDQQKQPEETQLRPQHRKLTSHPRFKRRHKSSEKNPRMVPSNSKASLPFQPPPPALDSLGPLAQLAQLPQMPMDPEELWVHEACIVWTSGVYLVNGKLYGLQEALDGARETCCSFCDMVGSTLGCYTKGCTLRYHYLCAIEADCSLNEDNFSLRCPKHKFTPSIRPIKSVYLEQSERG
ncbi:transcription factor 20 isoform X2 [Boleophthalmus pectinirostris]|uniref:transcription factor 20 isoform X2 n=1 Tax=Boleophthalmus pectinirostris TaxID=150288 RepID=UPI000A1C6072|nr:transcription factor 20 isoform X2 [Boleophthalmus pectinirostris]